MKIYEPAQNEFEKEINSIYRKAELLGWEIPLPTRIIHDQYKNGIERLNELDEVDRRIRLKNYLQILRASRVVFESRGNRIDDK